LASNHTTGLDPMLLQAASGRMIRWLMLTSYRFTLVEPLWRAIEPVTLDRGGRDLAKIRAIVSVLREGEVVGMFPEGGLQRTHRDLQPFEPGVAMVAKRSGAAIVPAWISGTPRRRNMLWQLLQPSRSRVRFGEPFHVDKSQDNDEIMQQLQRRMLSLAER
jgi:1-acyl-sn-glycerol-3-phosphate acyltransferase